MSTSDNLRLSALLANLRLSFSESMLASQSRFDADKLTFAKIIQAALQKSGIPITRTNLNCKLKSQIRQTIPQLKQICQRQQMDYHQLYLFTPWSFVKTEKCSVVTRISPGSPFSSINFEWGSNFHTKIVGVVSTQQHCLNQSYM